MIELTLAFPVFNEETAVEEVLTQAAAVAKNLKISYEILIVDDGSTDRTQTIISAFVKKNRNIRVVTHKKNKGFSGAIHSCYRQARGKWLFLLPGDGQVSPTETKRFWKRRHDADVLVGFRLARPESIKRRVTSWVFHFLYRILFGVQLREITTVIFWNTSVLRKIDITAKDRSALIEAEVIFKAWKLGASFAEVGVTYLPRIGGRAHGNDPVMMFWTFVELVRLRMTVK